MEQFLACAKITNTHGLKGDITLELWCDGIEFIDQFETLYIEKNKAITLEYIKPFKRLALAKIKGLDSVESILPYKNKTIYIDRNDVKLEEGVYFFEDLVGLDVVDDKTEHLYGKVISVSDGPAYDMYEVKCIDGGVRYLPAVDEFIASVDLEKGKLRVNVIEGLLNEI